MLENGGRGLIKALENWAKKVTSGYKDVQVYDLSKSFRDGLAFCAIIHHYRPDLIDFQSLSKENIFENNSLAFSVAEKQLGVPALLDADDMVQYAVPDRLSIITYLSQLRNCFENQNKVNKKHDLKRIQKSSSGPPAKISVVEPSLNISRRHEVCQVCKHRVFILERLMVDGKLYHTTCFRCHKCNTLLNPGAYVESDTPGSYECSVCPDEAQESLESFNETIEEAVESDSDDVETPVSKPINTPEKEFASKEAVSFAKSNLNIGDSASVRSNIFLYPMKDTNIDLQTKLGVKSTGSSVKDRINAFEKNQVNEKSNLPSSTISTPEIKLNYSPVESRRNEISSLSLSTKLSPEISAASPKSPEKANIEFEKEKEKLPKQNLFAKDFSLKENFLNGTIEKDLDIDKSDNSSNSNVSLQEVPILDSKTPTNEYKSLSREDSTFSIKSGSESPKSPKVPRDIFKSSLQPLKLSLSSSIRKETTDSPITPSESKKSFDIPQIKNTYPVALPRSNFGRTLSPTKEPVDIKISSSESNLSSSNNKSEIIPNRRSSLESSSKETSDKSKLEARSFQRTNSSYEISSSDDTDSTKNSLKNYTSVYKSLYNTSSLSNRNVSKFNSDNLLTLRQSHEVSKVVSDEIPSTEKDVCNSDILLNSISNNNKQLEIKKSTENLVSNKDSKDDTDLKTSQDFKETQEEDYPDDLNPFGDEDGETEENTVEYPTDLNPFGDDEEVVVGSSNNGIDDYDESKNPFASDDDEAEISQGISISSFKTTDSFNGSSNLNDSVASTVSSPSGSLKGTFKKRQAPKPPNVKDIFPKDTSDSGIDSSFNSMKVSPAITKKNILTSSPKVRKNKPAPPPPPSSPSLQDPAARVKLTKENDNMKLKSSSTELTQPPKVYKKKKRPAPPVPVNVRRDMKKIPLKEIMREMKEIEEKQREYECQGREIELLIRDKDKDEEASVEEEEYIMQLFELVNQKNALFRRQAELMYIKRSQRLEEQQYKIEAEIRQLMEKPESEKTDEDKSKEEELTMELIDIVDQRNSIIDSIEMDRRRELEEDHSVQEQFEMKNGNDLTITAELKQKSGKNKKNKTKKEKKEKKKQEEESGKGTLKKTKHLFSRKS